MHRFPSVSETKCVRSFNSDLQANAVHNLSSSDLDVDDQNACNTGNVTSNSCVITPNGQSAFTAAVFSVDAVGEEAGSTGGLLSIYGRPETGEPVTRQLTSSELTSQRTVNLTSLIGVPLDSVNFTYRNGADHLRFLMRIQGNVDLHIIFQIRTLLLFVTIGQQLSAFEIGFDAELQF